MPDTVRQDFNEARSIFTLSPRAACGLLRLAAEKLCAQIVGPDKNLNGATGQLVRDGVSPDIQEALDIVRLYGNDALHPGQVCDEDTRDRAMFLFRLLNVLVDDRIGLTRRLDAAYEGLSESLKSQIERRAGKS